MFRNMLRGEEVALSGAEQSVLLEHFPDMLASGIDRHSELAIELRAAFRRADSQQASAPARTPPRPSVRTPERSPAPRTATESSSGSNQRTLLGRFAGLMTPDQRRPSSASNASTSQRPVDRSPPRVNQVPTRPDRVAMRNRGNIDADVALRDLAQQGVNMGRLHAALGAHIMHGRALPEDLRRALGGVGIRPYNETSLSLMEHPLLNLNIALNRRLGPRPLIAQEPRPAVPMGPPSSSRRPSGTRAATLPVMPEREDHENNVSYGMRLLDLNPGVRVRTIVDAFIAEPARRPSVVAQIRELRAATKAISSQFSQLRTISKADAASEELGFKDAADHHLDDATHCLFGEPLSLGNQGQQVIGLAANPTGTSQSYSQEENKELVFMDMKKLAQFLVGKPEHPMTREPLDAENIAKYAFRLVP
ncbi:MULTISPECIES: E3 ubiquitin-protein ligase [Pseudomonas syringae group]|uniref:E3 ubiquitin-protein ligase n=3 Tax=Pseudomonas syringae group TaxID=136849 RepID=A0A8T8C1D2_PSEYM|nr:E3 ubiquitin-protein ligase [Pseudomonas cannabina]QHE97435.1 E3 ubiquitin-protein ligase [Pseudomonas syringae pv. maculicola str. ES4326]